MSLLIFYFIACYSLVHSTHILGIFFIKNVCVGGGRKRVIHGNETFFQNLFLVTMGVWLPISRIMGDVWVYTKFVLLKMPHSKFFFYVLEYSNPVFPNQNWQLIFWQK